MKRFTIPALAATVLAGTLAITMSPVQAQNRAKARLLYEVLDESNGFYTGHAQTNCRSMMNVSVRLLRRVL